MISRSLSDSWSGNLPVGKVLVLYGPRRVGKTTLISEWLKMEEGKILQMSGEDLDDRLLLEKHSKSHIQTFFSGYDLIFIDEVQEIPEIGRMLKLIVDTLPNLKVVITGSSSFGIKSSVGEPLVGRQFVEMLYPISVVELANDFGWVNIERNLEEYLVFGMYPEVRTLTSAKDKIEYLIQLRDGYLLKDILSFEQIKNSRTLFNLLQLIALQIGKEVSFDELGRQLGISKNTVIRYLDLLEKTFVLVSFGGFSRNLRKEVSKSRRYFFIDLGIRNAVINNFQPFHMRSDQGEIWENFLITERIKSLAYQKQHKSFYFWRTYDQQEIDWIESSNDEISAFEFKLNQSSAKLPVAFSKAYPDASFNVVNKSNWISFVSNQ